MNISLLQNGFSHFVCFENVSFGSVQMLYVFLYIFYSAVHVVCCWLLYVIELHSCKTGLLFSSFIMIFAHWCVHLFTKEMFNYGLLYVQDVFQALDNRLLDLYIFVFAYSCLLRASGFVICKTNLCLIILLLH